MGNQQPSLSFFIAITRNTDCNRSVIFIRTILLFNGKTVRLTDKHIPVFLTILNFTSLNKDNPKIVRFNLPEMVKTMKTMICKQLFRKPLLLSIMAGLSCSLSTYAAQTDYSALMDSIDIHKPNYIKVYQQVNRNDLIRQINESPAFAPGKENYLSTGAPIEDEFEKENADMKAQIELRYRFTKDIMPFHSYLIMNYRQTTFWHIFDKSMTHNFNPSIGLTKIIFKGKHIIGKASLMAEHESDGRDSLNNHGWNNVSLTGEYFFNPRLHFEGKLWAPFGIGKENSDLMKYRGYGYVAISAMDRSKMVRGSLLLNPRGKNDGVNLTLDLSFRLSQNDNRYIFFQYYKGYGEELHNYKQYHSMLRAGFAIKQDFASFF